MTILLIFAMTLAILVMLVLLVYTTYRFDSLKSNLKNISYAQLFKNHASIFIYIHSRTIPLQKYTCELRPWLADIQTVMKNHKTMFLGGSWYYSFEQHWIDQSSIDLSQASKQSLTSENVGSRKQKEWSYCNKSRQV